MARWYSVRLGVEWSRWYYVVSQSKTLYPGSVLVLVTCRKAGKRPNMTERTLTVM